MSSFALRRFTELVGEGVKTDKGFKDAHLNRVAKDLSEWGNLEVSGSQVYNHLHKWRARWVKICKLKELSGALWDEDLFMITLAPEHYSGHVKVT
jgi:methionine salvage enolase-phosphatase E1